jgi:protein-disulfide isomerase
MTDPAAREPGTPDGATAPLATPSAPEVPAAEAATPAAEASPTQRADVPAPNPPAAPAPTPWAPADALVDPAGTTSAMDFAPAQTTAEGADAATTAVPPLEPVEPAVARAVAAPGGRGGAAAKIAGYLVAALAGGAIVFAALTATGKVDLGASPAPSASASPDASAGSGAASTGGTLPSAGPGAAPVLGDADAPVLIEVWADYQCPYCALLTHAVEPAIIREYVESGQARLVYRDFAFLGDESGQAAGAARCAGQQGAYWRFHDLLFASQQGENQGAFAPKNLLQLAGFAGLDPEAFATCMADGATVKAATAETEEGRKLGIESTPTLHVVGPMGAKLVKGLVPMSAVEAAVTYVMTGVEPSPTPAPSAAGSPAASGSAAPTATAAP